ncbi:hypothetical protein MACH24_20850 [Erythrobacter sp. Dej080120_24]|uniref:hypothetical protein n=1 Tax=Erythrobacter sp. Dej080120_24 TaxID=3024837 RepID=UPI0029257D10|nr:hypothetical protein MACH24_20850 [Erythrobacter sp. Dej080120_24]
MTLAVFGKAMIIAIVAALIAWAYLLAFSEISGGDSVAPGSREIMLYGSLTGSFAIGLPVALLVFWMSHRHLAASPTTLAMIVVLAGIMMLLASFVIGDAEGMIVLGVPAFLAAATFGVLGWFWIIRPMRNSPK